jgi:uncharacterized protein YgiM (DUF1202 family)
MQNSLLKFILFVLILTFHTASTQAQSFSLQKADSLFQLKRYTQSLELYQYIFDHQHYTPAMLLKMAFIEEGLNHVAKAIYYLNLHYLATRDQSTLIKIEELASKHKLEGHTRDEGDRILSLYQQYHLQITLAIASSSFLLFSLLVFLKRKKMKPVGTFVLLILNLLILVSHINLGEIQSNAIIAQSNTYIMTGPSAGSSVITTAREGHQVKVLGQEDVWTKIRWNNKIAYVKHEKLIPVSF